MAATDSYALHVYDEDFVKQAVITDFHSLSYIRRVNWFDSLWFTISGDNAILPSISQYWIFNLRRRQSDGTWLDEVWSLFQDELWTYGSAGSLFTGYCEGITGLLATRIVNYPAGVLNRSKYVSDPAETIMKSIVFYNCTTGATTANGRKREGRIHRLSGASDSAGGSTIDWRCQGDNVLETLAEMVKQAGGDFKVSYDQATEPFFEFEFYVGQFGSDLSATVRFSMELGNMTNPQQRITRSSEKTVACVWGKGEGRSREYVTATGDNFVDTVTGTFGNDKEVYVDARSVPIEDTDGLTSKGDARMDSERALDTFTFNIIQTVGSRYRDDYDLGDLVTVINPFSGADNTYKVANIGVRLNESGLEEIEVELELE